MKNQKRELRRLITSRKTRWLDSMQSTLPDIFGLLEAWNCFQQAETVLFYHSLADEVNTHTFIEKWKDKKNLLLPVIQGDNMVLCPYEGEEKCGIGSFNILEPITAPYTFYDQIDLAIIPGVAFDRKGNRLGRGKGYYDRLLPAIKAPKVGICFSFQLLDQVPAEKFDIPMDFILTEKELIFVSH